MRLYARKQLDATWPELATMISLTGRRHDRAHLEAALDATWTDGRPVLAAYSVRTGFDLMLDRLGLEPGSEVVMTGVTIPHMVDIARHHGLVPVPIALDPTDMTTHLDEVRRAIGPNTRALLVTHLFGAILDLEPYIELAREHDLLLWEDCAQAFGVTDFKGHSEADATMFSFGTIKTATVFGGAILSIKDATLYNRMEAHARTYPQQSATEYRKKLLKYCAITGIQTPRLYGATVSLVGATGRNYDALLRSVTRSFHGGDFFDLIRKRPSDALVAALLWRVRTYDRARVKRRGFAGASFSGMLDPTVTQFGQTAPRHCYWLFPISTPHHAEVIERARELGFDATSGASTLIAIEGERNREAEDLMRDIVYLPVYDAVPEADLERLARCINEVHRDGGAS